LSVGDKKHEGGLVAQVALRGSRMIHGGLFAPIGRYAEHEPFVDVVIRGGTTLGIDASSPSDDAFSGPDAVRAGRARESRWGYSPPPALDDTPSSCANTPFDALRSGPTAPHFCGWMSLSR
jgi:hypothetical protein